MAYHAFYAVHMNLFIFLRLQENWVENGHFEQEGMGIFPCMYCMCDAKELKSVDVPQNVRSFFLLVFFNPNVYAFYAY